MIFFRVKLFFLKWSNYEYWHWVFFHAPLIPVYFYQVLRSGYFFYGSAANPGIDKGGLFGESKIDILNNFPDDYKPKTFSHVAGTDVNETLKMLKSKKFELPVILKPNVGERGTMVSKIDSFENLLSILHQSNVDFIIQEYIDYPYEFGVLYGKIPGEEKGEIRSVVMKKFLSVTGDGVNSIYTLLLKNKRAWPQIERLSREKSDLMTVILPTGVAKVIEPIGNHCRGTEFINANYLINDSLNEVFNNIAQHFEGFYYGRFDLKVRSIEEFNRGETIKIFELNGVTSEPGHIYDKNYTLLRAYSDIIKLMKLITTISIANIKRGVKPVKAITMLKIMYNHFRK